MALATHGTSCCSQCAVLWWCFEVRTAAARAEDDNAAFNKCYTLCKRAPVETRDTQLLQECGQKFAQIFAGNMYIVRAWQRCRGMPVLTILM